MLYIPYFCDKARTQKQKNSIHSPSPSIEWRSSFEKWNYEARMECVRRYTHIWFIIIAYKYCSFQLLPVLTDWSTYYGNEVDGWTMKKKTCFSPTFVTLFFIFCLKLIFFCTLFQIDGHIQYRPWLNLFTVYPIYPVYSLHIPNHSFSQNIFITFELKISLSIHPLHITVRRTHYTHSIIIKLCYSSKMGI